MATTVANFGIGLSMQSSGIVQPLHHAGAAIGSFSQQVSGLYLPASEASRGFGSLEDAMELLALRSIATETSLANLIHTTGRIAGASRTARTASQQNTVALQREAAAVTNISALRDRLIATLSRAPAGRPRLINTDADIQDIMRLRREIELVRNEHPVRREANRAVVRTGQIDTQVADLQARAQSTSAQMSGQSPELLRQANVLLQERAAIEAHLNSQLDETVSDAERIAQANAAINDVLTRRRGQIDAENAAHQQTLRMAEQQSRPQTLGNQRAEYAAITQEITDSEHAEMRLYSAAAQVGNTQQQNTSLAARATAETERRNGLMARQRQLQGDILTAEQQALTNRRTVGRLIESQNRAQLHARAMEAANPARRAELQQELAIRNEVNAKMRVFNAGLRESVRLQVMSVTEAQRLSAAYQQSAAQLARMNVQTQQASQGMGRMGFAMQNVGYGIEDAVSQFGTRGLAGAIGAASNNIAAMAMIFNSIKIQVGVSIGLALLQVAIQTGVFQKALVALGFTAEDTNKKSKDLAKTFDVLAESQVNLIDHQQSLNDLMDETSSVALANRLKGLRTEYAKLGVEQKRLQAQLLDETERGQSNKMGEELKGLKLLQLSSTSFSSIGPAEGGPVYAEESQEELDRAQRIIDLTAERAALNARINQRALDKEDTGRKILANEEQRRQTGEEMDKSDQRRLSVLREELVLLGKKNDLARTELGEAAKDPEVGQQNLAAIIAYKEESVRLDLRAARAKQELHDQIKNTADAERDYLQAKKDLQKAEAKAASPGAGRPSLEAEADEARDTISRLSSKKGGTGGFFGLGASDPVALSAEEEQVLAVSKRVLAAWRQHYQRVDGDKAKAQAAMEEADAIRTRQRQGLEGKQGELDLAVASQDDRGRVKVELNRELLRTKTELQRIETELQEQEGRGVQGGQDELTRQTSINKLLGEQATAQGKLNTLTKAGESAREKADKTLASLAGGLSKEIKKEQERARAAKDFREELERASELGMASHQVYERLTAFDTLNEKTDERDKLLKEKESLKKDLSERDKPATQQNAVEAGSAEAARIVADAILGGMNENENQPLIDAMLKNKEALDLIESAIRDIPVLNIQVAG